MDLTLRPMRYPHFYDRFRDAIKNTWTVEEVDLHSDLADLARLTAGRAAPGHPAGRVLRHRRHDRRQQPGAQPLPARQLPRGPAVPVPAAVRGGRARAVLPDPARHLRARRRRAGRRRSRRWRTSRRSGARPSSASAGSTRCIELRQPARRRADRRAFLLNLICFAACIEGLFFYGAFAYVYFLRSRGLLNGLASGTNWVFRDESMHMAFAFDVVETVRGEEPDLFDDGDGRAGRGEMLAEAVECEAQFAEDLLGAGVAGLSPADMRAYLEHVADRRLAAARARAALRLGQPVRVHGAAGRAGAVELLRAAGLGLPGRR